MKTMIMNLLLPALIAFSMSMNAQSPIDKAFDKYSGQDNFTTVNITKELFQMMMQTAQGESNDTTLKEIKSMIQQLNGIKVLTYKFDSTGVVKAVSVYNEFAGLFPASAYKELLTVNEGRQNVKFLTKQDAAGKINEMVMLMKDKSDVAVLSMTGVIDLASVAKLSKRMNIKGLDGLNRIKK